MSHHAEAYIKDIVGPLKTPVYGWHCFTCQIVSDVPEAKNFHDAYTAMDAHLKETHPGEKR